MSTDQPTYKHVIIPINMSESYQSRTVRRQIGTKKVQKTKGLLNPEKITVEEPVYEYIEEDFPTGEYSDILPNVAEVGITTEKACNNLAADGYEVISITPILRGNHVHEFNSGKIQKGNGAGGFGYGYGYSLTDSLLIVAKKIQG